MLVNTDKAADILGVQAATLTMLRSRGTGAPFIRDGHKVLYDTEDLEAYEAIKFAAHQGGNTYRNKYMIEIRKNGELVSILKRKAASLAHAVTELSLYPSLKDCEFVEVQAPKATPGQIERLRCELAANMPEFKKAFLAMLTGKSVAAKQAGQNKFNRLVDKSIKRAFNVKA